MHGARNDFVILDQRAARLDDLPSFARWVCDRHVGIGADGLIAIDESTAADLRMRTVNADGSEAEMCGNGIRCAARWVDEAGGGDRVVFETDAGNIATEIVARDPEYCVRVAMGWPEIAAISVPSYGEASFVRLGNPHIVILAEDVDAGALTAIVEQLERSALFREGVNVHVAALEGKDTLRARHWERGVGLTMACGTGAVACAAVAIGHFSKFIRTGAHRVAVSTNRPALQSTGFLNPDGSIVVIVMNTTDQPLPYHLMIKGKAATAESLAHSIATIVIK